MTVFTIVVSGTRHGSSDISKVHNTLKEISSSYESIHLVHGGCRGIDIQCARFGEKMGWKVTQVDAEWDKYGSRAGPIRNKKMLVEYKPDVVVCFPHSTRESRGTYSTIRLAKNICSTTDIIIVKV
jgi:hypothetical protein